MAELKALVIEVALPKSLYPDMALQLLHELHNDDVPKPQTEETIVVRPLPPDDTTDDGPNDKDESESEEESDEEDDKEDDKEELDDPKEGAPG